MKEGIWKEWMEIPSFYLRNVGGSFIFDCDYNLYLLNLATCLLSILIFSKRGLKSRGYAKLISTKITLEVVSCGIESFSTNEESDYEHEIWKKVVKSMRKVSNLVRRTRRTTSLKWKVVVGKRVGLLTEKAGKVDLIYFAGFKCALEDCYKHQHIDIHSRFVLKIAYVLELLLSSYNCFKDCGLFAFAKPRKGIFNFFIGQLIFFCGFILTETL